MKSVGKKISVVVITYNSSQFIEETLDSILGQSYRNFELIISDDGSADNTVELCKIWGQKFQNQLGDFKIITVPKNTGIPANCNRGIAAGSGEWIKLIAGDDILLPDCLESNLEFCADNKADICFSKMKFINQSGDPMPGDPVYEKVLERFFLLSQPQKKWAYLKNPIFINVPTEFFSRKLYEAVGGFDESIKLLEDQPFFYRVLGAGYDMFFLDKYTVKYRRHEGSVILNSDFKPDVFLAYQKYRKEGLSKKPVGKIISYLEQNLQKKRKAGQTEGFVFKVKSKFHYLLTRI